LIRKNISLRGTSTWETENYARKFFGINEEMCSFQLSWTAMYLDGKLLKGCHYYSVEIFMPTPPFGVAKWGSGLGHGPHAHKDAEILMHLGTNPDDPTDLGAEVELYMGKEMGKHVITRSCVVYIPLGLVH
jgi:hypothetical protein